MNDLLNKKTLILAIPGFVALFAANFVSDMPTIRDSQLPFVYILLSLISLSIPLVAIQIYRKFSGKILSIDKILSNFYFLSATFLFSIFVGFSFGVLHTTDSVSSSLRSIFGKDIVPISSHNELVRELFSRAYSSDFPDGRFGILPAERFDFPNRYARITIDGANVVYEGVITQFFSGNDTPQVYLSPSCKLTAARIDIIKGPGTWVNLNKVESIDFVDARCSGCSAKHEEIAGRVGGKNCPY